MSVGALKRAESKARKEAKEKFKKATGFGNPTIPNGPRFDHFMCANCAQETPDSELALIKGYHNTAKICKACIVKTNKAVKRAKAARNMKPRPFNAFVYKGIK